MLKGDIIMKKFLFLLLALTFSVALVACNEENYIPTEGLEYNELADGTYEVVGIGSATALDIVIPAKHNGKSVTSIASNAFNGCYNIKSVIISNGITSIGEGAFNGCTSLEEISVDDNNKYYSSDKYGVLLDKEQTKIIQFPIGSERASYVMPDTVTTVES